MGAHPPHGTVPRKFSTRGRTADNGETDEDTGGVGPIIPAAGNSNGGGRLRGDWGLYFKEAEDGHAIYCDTADSRPLQEDGAEDGGMGCLEVVVTGGSQPIECKGAVSGGSGRGGGEG